MYFNIHTERNYKNDRRDVIIEGNIKTSRVVGPVWGLVTIVLEILTLGSVHHWSSRDTTLIPSFFDKKGCMWE